MNKIRDVAFIVGSIRKESINRKMANALAELVPPSLKLSIIEIGHLPIYNQDGEENPPTAWTQFRERIRAADAILFVTPEPNRSVPAALKNALDIGSRNHHLLQSLVSERSSDGATGGLSRPRRQAVRRKW